VDRSYCGSPLEVLVQFASPLDASLPTGQADQDRSPPFDLANAFVFARFESENDDALSGGPHSLRDLRSASQRNEEAGPVWIEGIRSLQSHGSRTPGSSMSSTFTLNGEPFDKWHHHWESGANRSQRSTRHALKAYVFYVRSDRQHSSEHFEQSFGVQQEQIMDAALEQLCVVSSPLFTVTSYRRSSSNAPATSVDTATVQQPGEMETAALRVHHFEMNESRREERHQLAHEAYQVRPPRYQEHRRQALPPPEDQEEEEVARRSNQSFSGSHQDRQAHQREEGLDLLLLSPEEAAQSAPFLHSLIQSCEPRLVFARKRHRAGSYQRRGDATRRGCGYRAADGRGDVERQGPTLHHESRSKTYEGTPATRPVGTPSSFLWPVRTTAREARNAPQRALGAALHQLSDLAVIHLVASRVTAISARRGSSTLPEVLAVAIAEFWRCGRGEAQQLAQLVFAAAGGGGDANATSVRGRSESSSSEEALSALARVTIWTASPANLEWMQSLLAACSPGVRSSSVGSSAGAAEDEDNELRSAFFKCVGRCWVRLDEFLQIHRATHPTIRSVRDLSDAMLGFVYCDPALEALRPELRAVLQTCAAFYESSIGNARGSHGHDGDGSLVLWRHFVAKARESYMVRARIQSMIAVRCSRSVCCSPDPDTMQTSRSPRCGFPAQSASSSWTDEWVLQPDSLAVVSPGGGHLVAATHSVHEETVPSLWTSCCTIAQLLRVKLAVAGESLYLVPVRGPWCSSHVHDGKFTLRVFVCS
jgi:hypothetical protein